MPIKLSDYRFSYISKRFQEAKIGAPYDSGFVFSEESKILFAKAIEEAVKSSQTLLGTGKPLPLQGVIDLNTKTIYIGALTPRDADAFVFNEEPLFEHKKPGLFESGRYSPRLVSYQTKYSAGPSAHQQLLLHAVNKAQVSADDAENKRGIALNIQVTDQEITIAVDGKSLSINETAQYLRTIHRPGHELTEHEARNDILKASKIYSELCENWIFGKIVAACQEVIDAKIARASYKHSQQFFSPISTTTVDDIPDEGYGSVELPTTTPTSS